MRIMGNTRRQPEMLHEVDPSLVLNLMSLKWQAVEGGFIPSTWNWTDLKARDTVACRRFKNASRQVKDLTFRVDGPIKGSV
jgi:hypothetical protein